MSAGLVAMVLLSAMLHASWNALLKVRGGDAGTIWASQVLGSLLVLPLALWRLDVATLDAEGLGWLALAGAIQGVYFALLGRAYARGDLSLVYPLARGGGVALAALASAFVFHDALGAGTIAGVLLVCCGTVVLGGAAGGDLGSVGLALLVALSLGAGSTADKMAVNHLDPAVYAVGQFAAAALVAAPTALRRDRASVVMALTTGWRWSAAIGVLSIGSYGLALLAFQSGPLATVVALRESSVVFAAILAFGVLKEPLSRRRVAGVLTVVAGLVTLRLG